MFLGSACTITEDPATLTAPPSATDPSWVWLPPTYDPGQNVVVTSATTPVAVTVTNRIQQLTGSFNLTKVVTGAGKDGGYVPGTTFRFDVSCTNGFAETVTLADTDSFSPAAAPPVGTQCTIQEVESAADRSGLRLAAGPVHRRRRDADREHRDLHDRREHAAGQCHQHHRPAVRVR